MVTDSNEIKVATSAKESAVSVKRRKKVKGRVNNSRAKIPLVVEWDQLHPLEQSLLLLEREDWSTVVN